MKIFSKLWWIKQGHILVIGGNIMIIDQWCVLIYLLYIHSLSLKRQGMLIKDTKSASMNTIIYNLAMHFEDKISHSYHHVVRPCLIINCITDNHHIY